MIADNHSRGARFAVASCVIAIVILGAIARERRATLPAEGAPVVPPTTSVTRIGVTATAKPRTQEPHGIPLHGIAAGKPWWAELRPEEVEARRHDFDRMRNLPGAYPEFSEIHRQLLDSGVPIQVIEMECREVFGALLECRQYEGMEFEQWNALSNEPDEPLREGLESFRDHFHAEGQRAWKEANDRLASLGIDSGSEAGQRILQLNPKTPLARLDTDIPDPASQPMPPVLSMEDRLAAMRAQIDAMETH